MLDHPGRHHPGRHRGGHRAGRPGRRRRHLAQGRAAADAARQLIDDGQAAPGVRRAGRAGAPAWYMKAYDWFQETRLQLQVARPTSTASPNRGSRTTRSSSSTTGSRRLAAEPGGGRRRPTRRTVLEQRRSECLRRARAHPQRRRRRLLREGATWSVRRDRARRRPAPLYASHRSGRPRPRPRRRARRPTVATTLAPGVDAPRRRQPPPWRPAHAWSPTSSGGDPRRFCAAYPRRAAPPWRRAAGRAVGAAG